MKTIKWIIVLLALVIIPGGIFYSTLYLYNSPSWIYLILGLLWGIGCSIITDKIVD